ncbi:MAG TPA: chemotaxis protein CheW [Methylophilaceae bacterium]|nr:chemotaxis protein CheW [Methylophilaceae bacterium]
MNARANTAAEHDVDTGIQYLGFHIGPHAFALPLDDLREILRVPPIALVPLSPPSLRGLANLRGVVLPIINLHHLFNAPQVQEGDAAARVLVLDGDHPVGVVADRVTGIFSGASRQADAGKDAKIDKNYLAGILHRGKEASMLIDFPAILEKEFIASQPRQVGHDQLFSEELSDAENAQQTRLVTFSISEQEYAFPVERVEEIVFLPERLLQIPNADDSVAGVIELHKQLLPVFHLRALLSYPQAESTADSRIVVIPIQIEDHQRQVGLIVDAVSEVLQIPEQSLEAVPKFFGHESASEEITAICRLSEQERLISVLSGEALFGERKVRELIESVHDTDSDDADNEDTIADEMQLVIFRLLDEEFALPTDAVQEILNMPELVPLPKAPKFIEGIFNYRGTVTPVVNQRRRMGLPEIVDADRQRIVMIDLDGIKTGFLVDSITEILRVPTQLLDNPPELFQSQLHMVQKVVHPSPARMILMLDTRQLLNSVELKALTEATREKLK